ncbi:MAG: hypothetical protein AAAFM81_15300, partial [Pseudomonadota bacterium]
PLMATRNATMDKALERLDGGACLNQRSILTACDLFDPTEKTEAPITFDALMEALWFLELSIVSKAITFDGTLPPQFINTLRTRLDAFAGASGIGEHYFADIKPVDWDEQKRFLMSSAARGLDDVHRLIEQHKKGEATVLQGLDKHFAEEKCAAFFDALRRTHDALKATDQDELDDQLVRDLAQTKDIAGGKCIAGIALAGSEATDLALSLPETLGIPPEKAMSVLINRFRFTYVRQLAFGAQDVYVPASRWKGLSETHALTFAEVVRQEFARKHADTLKHDLEAALHEEHDGQLDISLPPIGLYALMRASANARPMDVVAGAVSEFERYGTLFREFWRQTRKIEPPKDGWTTMVGDHALDQYHVEIERTLSDELNALKHRSRSNNPTLLERFVCPVLTTAEAIGGSGIGAVLGVAVDAALGGGALGAAGSGALGGLVGKAAERLSSGGKSYLCRHFDDYRQLDDSLMHSAHELRLDRLGEQVEAVFGRKLVMA